MHMLKFCLLLCSLVLILVFLDTFLFLKIKIYLKKIKLYIYMFGGYWVKSRHTKKLSHIQVCGTERLCKLRSACMCVNVYMQDII